MWVDPKLRGGDDDQHVNKTNWTCVSFHSFYLPDFVLIHLWVESLLSGLKVCYNRQEKNQSYHMCVTKVTNHLYILSKKSMKKYTSQLTLPIPCSVPEVSLTLPIERLIIIIEVISVLSNFCIWLDRNCFWMLEMRKLCVYIIISTVSLLL